MKRNLLLTISLAGLLALSACGESEGGGCQFNSDCAQTEQCVDARCVSLEDDDPDMLTEGDADQGAPDQGTPDQGTPDEGSPDEGSPDEGSPDMEDIDIIEDTPEDMPVDMQEDMPADMQGDTPPDDQGGEDQGPDAPVCEPIEELCDGADNDCDGEVDEGCDDDEDGYCDAALPYEVGAACEAGDCADGDGGRNPGVAEVCDGADNDCDEDIDDGVLNACGQCGPAPEEVCDGADNDCDGVVDNGCDDDGDGDCDGAAVVLPGALCDNTTPDCDDEDEAINADAAEICDGRDNNCDEAIDEGCDDDGDGYCDDTIGFVRGQAVLATCPNGPGDCDDTRDDSSPADAERCDGRDNSCDGNTDEGCDDDADGFCDAALPYEDGALCPNGPNDCDDTRAALRPDAAEICDGIDNDCDGARDEGCDDDQDGYCDVALPYEPGALCPNGPNDCNDLAAAIHPDAAEICDGIDNNCAAAIDEGCDDDEDGFCDAEITFVEGEAVRATCPNGPGDCDDSTALTAPNAAERCDGLDNSCNNVADEGCDDDADGYCDAALPYEDGALCVNGPGDCDDVRVAVNPAADEICDGLDNDCDEAFNEGCDDDEDGFCDAAIAYVNMMGVADTCPNGGGDCDDDEPATFPRAAERCDNEDNDCDQTLDEGCDDDRDGYCDMTLAFVGPAGLAACPNGPNDCADAIAEINPGATERCDGLADDDCDGTIDDGCDDDMDGYCDRNLVFTDTPQGRRTCPQGGNDCNDDSDAINPAAREVCDGGVDNDCDNFADQNDSSYQVPCAKTEGVCAGLMERCVNGAPEPCDARYEAHARSRGEVYQEVEGFGELLCDGDDNNCDGRVDESCDPGRCQHLTPPRTTQMSNHVSRAPVMAQSPEGLIGVAWFQAPLNNLQSGSFLHYAVLDPASPVIDVHFVAPQLASLFDQVDITWDPSGGRFLLAAASRRDPVGVLQAGMLVEVYELNTDGALGQRHTVVSMSRSQPAYRFGDLVLDARPGRIGVAYTLRSEANTSPALCHGERLSRLNCVTVNLTSDERPQGFTNLGGEHQLAMRMWNTSEVLLSHVIQGTSTLRLFRVSVAAGNVLTRASVDVLYSDTPVWQRMVPDPNNAGMWLVAHTEFSNNPARRWGALRRWNPNATTTTSLGRDQVISVLANEQNYAVGANLGELLRTDMFGTALYVDGARYEDHTVSRFPSVASPAARTQALTPVAVGSDTPAGLHLLFVDDEGQTFCVPPALP